MYRTALIPPLPTDSRPPTWRRMSEHRRQELTTHLQQRLAHGGALGRFAHISNGVYQGSLKMRWLRDDL